MAKEVTEKLRTQLAVAVRSIQWSYAIFWSISAKQPGVLEWGDGYYNGDIKTRKTVQAEELNPDELGLQRSDQLRELYESLQLGETNPQLQRPTAALSPEDLTDAEWYFLVCMSFVFNIGQGFPGRALAKNQPLWLRNAHIANTKVFSRSLLAKSASIQTIVCFPYSGGVIELGTTELVSEDMSLIHHIKTSFLESPSATPSHNITTNNVFVSQPLDHANIRENNIDQPLDCPDNVDICSPENCSDDFADNLLRDESNLLEGSMNSSDCISQTYGNLESIVPLSDANKATDNLETQECNQQKHDSFSFSQGNDDIRYQSVLSNLLKSSHQLILGPYFRNGNRESSFVSWKKDKLSGARVAKTTNPPQRLLKKVLFDVARMHENSRLESGKQKDQGDGNSRLEVDESDRNHVLSERKRREKISERFTILGSLVPSGGKVDKVSILDHTIKHLRELERKVEELESYKEVTELESGAQGKTHDSIERTSDNYGHNNIKKPSANKRKARDSDKKGEENKRVRLKDPSADSIIVSVRDGEVSIEMRCPWRDCVFLEVMEAISKLNLDSQTVQSSNNDGILAMTVKAKYKGSKGASAGVIKQALQKIVKKSC